jgi:methionyl-tRNA synthetase
MLLVKAANKFFNDRAPWKLAKAGKIDEMGGVLYACVEVLRIVSVLLYPVLPNKMRDLRAVFSLTDETLTLDSARSFFVLEPGTEVTFEDAIFPRLETKKKEAPKEDASGVNLITIDDFFKSELKVAEVLTAEKVEGADKLLKLQIEIGPEKRQIIAGVADFYTPDEITGKKIIVVTNLQPATIRGVESHGMLLAAKKKKQLVLVTVDGDIPSGAKVG